MSAPKKKGRCKKRVNAAVVEITDDYYVQAVRRSKLYAEDFRKYDVERAREGVDDIHIGVTKTEPIIAASVAGKKLCAKWGLSFPVAPVGAECPAAFKITSAGVRKIDSPPEAKKGPISFPTIKQLKDPRVMRCFSVTGHDEFITHIDGKLCVLIDLGNSFEMIMNSFKNHLQVYGNINIDKYTNKTKVDPWEVYDAVTRHKGNQLAAAQELLKFEGIPSYSETADKHYKKFTRSYQKAIDMIDIVEKKSSPKKTPKA